MSNYGLEAYEFLEKLSFRRTSGSAEEHRAAEMILARVRELGYEGTMEPFEVSQMLPAEAELTLTAPEKVSYTVTGMIDAGETGPEGMDAEFYYPGNLDEITLPKCKGKFVLLTARPNEKEYRKLKEAGIVGFAVTNGTMRDTVENADLDTMRFRTMYFAHGKMPAFAIRVIDAMDLLRRKPEKVQFKLTLAESKRTSRNIIVEVPGTEKPEEVIVAGAHYDSTEFSYGAWDNGAGVTHLLGLLSALKQNPPKRTVRVIFFGSEEIGLEGSKAYVAAHEEELGKILYMVNSDVGGSILGGEMLCSTAHSDMEGYLHGLQCECGYSARLSSGIMSSDSIVFSDAGIPSLSMGQMPVDGANFMHTRYDSFARISADVLDKEIQFLIFLMNRLTSVAVFPVARVIPKDLRDKIVGYFGKDFCKTAKQTEFPEEPEPRRPLF